MAISSGILLRALRATAESTRLRMLAVLARGEFTVTDLTRIFGQSQPRVSRQLKLLNDAGLLERSRDQHWVFYRAATDGAAAAVVQSVLALVDPDDAQTVRDRTRATEIAAERDARGEGPTGDDAATDLAAIVPAELGRGPFESLLYAGRVNGDVLTALAPLAGRIQAVGERADEVRGARALLRSLGLRHCTVTRETLASLPFAAGAFETVVVDCTDAKRDAFQTRLAEASRVLQPGGRLLLIADYEQFDSGAARPANPLQAARERLASLGLACERLRPLDANGRHFLIALASSERAVVAA